METYQIDVIETRQYQCTYTVTAASPEEARRLAERGETIAEQTGRLIGVTDRYVD